MRKRAQSSIEFIVISAFLLISVFGFLSFLSTNATEVKEQANSKVAEDIGEYTYREIESTRTLNDGYIKLFLMPVNVNGADYNITLIDNRELVVEYLGYEYIKFLPDNIKGNITRGYNVISKEDGIVYINAYDVKTFRPYLSNGTTLDCQVTTSCPYTTLFRMSFLTDAHSESHNSSDYLYSVCCRHPYYVLNNSCQSGTVVVKLSNTSDAHTEFPSLPNEFANYTTDICLSSQSRNFECALVDDADYPDCISAGYETCVATLSAESDAHAGDCETDPYQLKVCCR